MIPKIVNYWKSLPHPVQAVIMLFGGAATGVLKHSLEAPNACLTTPCLEQYAIAALHAGAIAVIALYIPANFNSANSASSNPPAK